MRAYAYHAFDCICPTCQRARIADALRKADMESADDFLEKHNLLHFPIERTRAKGDL